jgi:hypothetical protein
MMNSVIGSNRTEDEIMMMWLQDTSTLTNPPPPYHVITSPGTMHDDDKEEEKQEIQDIFDNDNTLLNISHQYNVPRRSNIGLDNSTLYYEETNKIKVIIKIPTALKKNSFRCRQQKVQFTEHNSVIEIPHRLDYSTWSKLRMWNNFVTINTMKCRMRKEIKWEQKKNVDVLEEDSYCKYDGELIHPAHVPKSTTNKWGHKPLYIADLLINDYEDWKTSFQPQR